MIVLQSIELSYFKSKHQAEQNKPRIEKGIEQSTHNTRHTDVSISCLH